MQGTLKDKLTNIAAVLGVVVGAIFAAQTQGVPIPVWLQTTAAICAAAAVGITSFLTGKTGDGKPKPPTEG